MTIINAEQTKKCLISKDRREFEVNAKSVAVNIVKTLDEMDARVDEELIGAMNYAIGHVTCTRPVVRNLIVTCSYDKRLAVKTVALDDDQIDAIFDALDCAVHFEMTMLKGGDFSTQILTHAYVKKFKLVKVA